MPRYPAQIAAASCYVDGDMLPDIAEVELPEIEFDSAEIEAFGIAGTLKTVIAERLSAMEVTFKPRSVTGSLAQMLRIGRATSVDCRFVISSVDAVNRSSTPVGARAVIRCQPMGLKTPNIKPGTDDSSEVKAAVSYYRLAIAGRTVIECDPINFILTVDGEDLLAPVRALL